MRHFVVVSHTVPPNGDWGLDDLAGAAGRVDVLCRAVSSALFVSHGIRDDTRVTLVFQADPDAPVAVRFDGARVRRLNPDERSTASRIRNALQHRGEDPWWEEVEPGVEVAPLGLREVLEELHQDGTIVLLDRDGRDLEDVRLGRDPVFVLSDHQPFSVEDRALLRGRTRQTVSIGDRWYHGHHVIGVIHYVLDRRA